MAINFPDSPTIGDTFTTGGGIYQWDGTSWNRINRQYVTNSDAAPSNPRVGDLWFDTDNLILFAYYDDGDSVQWVAIDGGATGVWNTDGTYVYYEGSLNVGIGTTTPDSLLHISSAFPEIRIQDTDEVDSYMDILYNGGDAFLQVDPADSSANSSFIIEIDGSERLRINASDEHVGIGTSIPTETLDVVSEIDNAAIQIASTRQSANYYNAGIQISAPRDDTADGAIGPPRGLIMVPGTSTTVSPRLMIATRTATADINSTPAEVIAYNSWVMDMDSESSNRGVHFFYNSTKEFEIGIEEATLRKGTVQSSITAGISPAWVRFTQTSATVNESYNITSVNDNATGDATNNFTNNMSGNGYNGAAGSTALPAVASNSGIQLRSFVTTSYSTQTSENGVDSDEVSFSVIYGDLA